MSTQFQDASIQPVNQALRGMLDIFPLALATAPWGVLCGSLALDTGLSALQAQLMSLLVFAGAVQLASFTLIPMGSLTALLGTSTIISSRHLLYSAVFRDHTQALGLKWRVILAFLLTDEMFAVTMNRLQHTQHFSRYYALGAGATFYLGWNLASLTGILLGRSIPNLENLGFEFAVAATFIAIVIPEIRDRPTLLCVVTSGVSSVAFAVFGVSQGLLISTLAGMVVGYFVSGFIDSKRVQP